MAALSEGFEASGSFIAQPGYVDFDIAGAPASAATAGANDISPRSNSSTAGPREQSQQIPDAGCEPSCAFSNPSAAYGIAVLPLSPSEDAAAKAADPATPAHEAQNLDGRYGPGGLAPSWQLRQDEVVVLAGCTPPAEASR